MKRIESDIGAFDFAECGTEHELGSCLAEAHVSYCDDLIHWAGGSKFATILADPPWRFQNSTGKVAPEHKRLRRYATLSLKEILALPVSDIAQETAHLYLWVPNALLPDGLAAMQAWGFTYKTNLVWHKIRKDGGSDGRGCGFYFRNVTEWSCLACAGSMPGLSIPVAGKSITSPPKSGNTRESLMSFIPSSRRALRGRMRSCSRAGRAWGGNAGASNVRISASAG